MNHTYRLVWSPTQQRYVPTAETARSRGKSASGKALLPAAVVLSTALLSSPGFAQAPPALAPNALPTGGQVVAGQASIGQHGRQMTITQGTDKAILNWNSFNIGQDARVQFQQPGSGAVALNRVVAGDASQIQGQLAANGQVWLVNPNGVVFGPGSRVDVGGLVASTLSITDKDFLDGKVIFNRDGATGGIVNEGQITAVGDGERGGLIALLAPTVRNDGVLTAKLGNVALAAGDRITLNAGAGGLLQVEVEPATLRTLVENRQMIVADGGQVVMTGRAADALSGSVVANTGTVQARSIANQQGRIMLLGDAAHGSVQVSGLLDASAPLDQGASAPVGVSSGQVGALGGQGGSIEVTGQRVALAGATLDTSGATSGGDIKVGGGWQGGGTLARAKTTTVDAASRLKADATQKGDGGTVVVWSDDKTRYAGHISAKGGSTGGKGGKGGKAEVSGKAVLDFTGTADLSAAQGRSGDLLLDPYNLTIEAGSGGTPDGSNNFVAAADDSTLGVNTLTNLLATANVTVSTGGTGSPGAQAGNITVNAPVAWSANNVLTLEAAGDIAINQNITATGVSAGLVLSHGTGKDYQLGEGASVTLSGASASLKIGATGALNTYTLLRDVNALQAIPANSTGNFALAGDVDASPLSSGAGFAPITDFGGTFSGLGHVINGLVINLPGGMYVGLFGTTNSSSTLRNVGLIGGSVTGGAYNGGLVGINRGALSHVNTTGAVISRDPVVAATGGLAGANEGSITHAYASGAVTGVSQTGGLVGQNRGTITRAYATGNVTASSDNTGGLVGINLGVISQAYATGAVRGTARVGGLAGSTSISITDAYATGAVTSTSSYRPGGLVGENSGTVTRSFYATTQADGSSINNGGVTNGTWSYNNFGTGKTYAELMNPSTFSGLNTTIWNVAGGDAAPGYQVGLPALTGVTPAVAIARTTLFQGGMGTSGNPYGITDWQQLANINQVLAGGYSFNLNNNLDGSSGGYNVLASATANSGLGWKPLGDDPASFSGNFNGQNHTIASLFINRPTQDYIGLFGNTSASSSIRNVGLLGGSITGLTSVGELAGANAGTVADTYATGTVHGVHPTQGQAGGLVGLNLGTITRAYTTGSVTGTRYTGGLVGAATNTSNISLAYATGSVTGTGEGTGGLVGLNTGNITRAYATGAVAGWFRTGGLVGFNSNLASIGDAYATGAVSSTTTATVGGLAGENSGAVTRSFYATTDADGSTINNAGIADTKWSGNNLGTAKTRAELMAPATFTGWDPAIWTFARGNLVAGYEVGLLPALTGVTRTVDMTSSTLFQGGMGNTGSPYGITDWQQLANINQVLAGGYTFNLNNNLDGSSGGYNLLASATANAGLGWQPLGDDITRFSGSFDGQNHTITGMFINRPTQQYVGLFGSTNPGSNIKNVGLLGGTVVGLTNAGGLAGWNRGAITRAYATGTVQAADFSGQVGGLVGVNAGTIAQAYATGNVIGSRYVGGLAGVNATGGSITDAHATGAVTGAVESIGGLVGINIGSINYAFATGDVSGPIRAGGLVGNNDLRGSINEAYATGTVTSTSTSEIGGLVGANFGSGVTKSFYATTNAGGGGVNNGGVTTVKWSGNGQGSGKTYSELMSPATFSSWGINLATEGGSNAIWRIYAGSTTPLLRSFLQAATVTADLSAASKTYNGTIASGTAPFTSNVAGPLLGALSYASNSANAGTYATADSSLQLGGLYSGPQGYDISYAPASLVITPVVLVPGGPSIPGNTPSTITGILAGTVRKTYDGTNVATLGSGNFQLSGWVSSDGAIVTKTVGRYDNANAGSGKTVTVDLALGDYQATGTTNLGNYLLPTQVSGTVGTVDKAALTVSANNASKTYDGQAWRGGNGVAYSGFVNGETTAVLTGVLSYGGTSQGAVEVGNYLLTPQGLNSSNYAIDYRNGTLSVANVAGGIPGGGNPGVGNPGSGSPGTGNPGTGNPGNGNSGGGNTGGSDSGGSDTGGANPGIGNPVIGNLGGSDASNGDTFADSGPAPSGSNLWRALNRATPPFMLPQDTDSRREISVPHLSLAPGYIRLQEEETALPRAQ